MATLPSTFFDGTDNVLFTAIGLGADGDGGDGEDDDEDDDGNANSAAAHQAQRAGDASSSPQGGVHSALQESGSSTGEESSKASLNVTFFHCPAGSFWDRDPVSGNGLDAYTGNCTSCADGDLDSLTEV